MLRQRKKSRPPVDVEGYSPLQQAVINNDLKEARDLLAKGEDCTYEKPIDPFTAVDRGVPQAGCALAMALELSTRQDMQDMIALLLHYYPRSALQQNKALLTNVADSNIQAMLIRAGAYLDDDLATTLLEKSIEQDNTPLALAICQQGHATSIQLPAEIERKPAAEAVYQYFINRNRQHIAIIFFVTVAAMLVVTYIKMHYHMISIPIFIAAHAVLGIELVTSCTLLSMRLPAIELEPPPKPLQNKEISDSIFSRIIKCITPCNSSTSCTNTKSSYR